MDVVESQWSHVQTRTKCKLRFSFCSTGGHRSQTQMLHVLNIGDSLFELTGRRKCWPGIIRNRDGNLVSLNYWDFVSEVRLMIVAGLTTWLLGTSRKSLFVFLGVDNLIDAPQPVGLLPFVMCNQPESTSWQRIASGRTCRRRICFSTTPLTHDYDESDTPHSRWDPLPELSWKLWWHRIALYPYFMRRFSWGLLTLWH